MQETIKCPKALQHMVDLSNQRLKELQQTYTVQILEAAQELMTLLNISPEDGWTLDLDNMMFIRNIESDENAPIS